MTDSTGHQASEVTACTGISKEPSRMHSLRGTVLGQFTTFTVLGLVGTAFFFALYNVFRFAMSPLAANALAVALSMGFSFIANRRITFNWRGRESRLRHLIGFTIVIVATLALSSGVLVALDALTDSNRVYENLVLILAHGGVIVLRFSLLRRLVFQPR